MTNEQITKWAVEVGMNPVMEWGYTRFASPAQLQAFAQLVRNATLEEAAIKSWSCGMDWHMRRNNTDVREVGSAIANEIRSMKK